MLGGRGAFHQPVKFQPGGGMEEMEVRMLAGVAIIPVKFWYTESLRFPE